MSPLHCTDTGGGTPILWIHGFPLASQIFREQLAIRGARHLIPDLPGFGRTPALEGTLESLMMGDYTRMMVGLLDTRGIERAIFAGLSMGGYIALATARSAPERIGGLILLDTRETADTEEGRNGRLAMIAKVRKDGIAPVVDAMLPKMLTASAPQAMRDEVRTIMEATTAAGAIAALHAMVNRESSSDLLPQLDVPALVIVGEEDAITPPADAERMAAALPRARLVRVAGAAHLANVERADVVNHAIEDYVNQR